MSEENKPKTITASLTSQVDGKLLICKEGVINVNSNYYEAMSEYMGRDVDPTQNEQENLEKRKHIADFLQQMKAQNNRGTAFPYFYVIRDVKEVSGDPDNCDTVRYYSPDFGESFESKQDFIEYLMENEEIKESEAHLHDYTHSLKKYGVQEIFVEHGMFLTETDAVNHLASNKHHYTSNAYTYVKHAHRAPELKQFFENLFDYFEVK